MELNSLVRVVVTAVDIPVRITPSTTLDLIVCLLSFLFVTIVNSHEIKLFIS